VKRIIFWVLGALVIIFLLSFFWLKIGSGVLFYVEGGNKSGLKLSSQGNLFRYLVKLEKYEKAPLLLLIKFNDYVPNSQKSLKIYRRFEPVAASPIVIGCNWKKNSGFWNIDFFIDQNLLTKTDIKSINLAVDACFVQVFNEKFTNTSEYEQAVENSIKLINSINQGIIFKKW